MKFHKSIMLMMSVLSLSACNLHFLPSSSEINSNDYPLERLITPKVEKISTTSVHAVSLSTYNSYMAFARKFTSLMMEANNSDGEKSLGISIPDAYICLAIAGVISEQNAMNDVLSYLELSSIEQLRTAIKEIVANFATLYRDRDDQLTGGYNLNSIWLNPEKVKLVEEKDPELYKDLEEIFDASLYMNPLTSDAANQYIKDNGLKDMPAPKIKLNDDDPSALSVMSVYYCLGFFPLEMQNAFKNQFLSGSHKMDYMLNGVTSQVDYICSQGERDVYVGSGFYGSYLPMNSLNMAFFLPNDKNALPSTILSDVLTENYHCKQATAHEYTGEEFQTTIHDITINAPYFSLENESKLEYGDLKKILPAITNRGAGNRLAESIFGEDLYLSAVQQFSVMKFNYDGFYSCSATIASVDPMSSIPPEYEKFELNLNHPYIFEVRKNVIIGDDGYQHMPLVIGEIVMPDYQE